MPVKRAKKNESRALDQFITPEAEVQYARQRNRYKNDLKLFANEQLMIVDKHAPGGSALIPFDFNECQQALHSLIERVGDFNEMRSRALNEYDSHVPISRLPIEIVVLKARKVGVSTYFEARAFWKAEFNPHTNVLVMAHERNAAQNIVDIAQRFDVFWSPNTEIPLRRQIVRSSDDIIEWEAEHDSRFVVQTAGKMGGGSSRSFSYQFFHFSEIAFFPADSEQLAAAMRAKTEFYEMFLESTANGEGNIFHDEWSNALYLEEALVLYEEKKPFPKWWNGKFKFFWAWHQDSHNRIPLLPHEKAYVEESLDEAEKQLIEDFGVNYEQLAWRRRQINGECSKQNRMTPEEFFRQEDPSTPEEAFVAKSPSVFDPKKINLMIGLTNKFFSEGKKPFFQGFILRDPEIDEGWKFRPASIIEGSQLVQWEPPDASKAYVIGVDCAEGLEHGDWTVISVFDRCDGTAIREVARYRAKTPAEEAGELAVFLAKLYEDAYIVCERNAPGNAACNAIVHLAYPHIYHARNIELFTDKENPEGFTAGFITNKQTKGMIVQHGITAIRDDQILIRHPDALKEWKIFANVNGKYGAPDGDNDDCVMADLLALFGSFEAPPLWVGRDKPIDPNAAEKKGEEAQNEYWLKKLSALRQRCREENQKKLAYMLRKVNRPNPFN
jgi:hypothetical protein